MLKDSIQYSVFSNCVSTVTVSPSGPPGLFKGVTTIKSPIFTGGFRLIDLLCQSYPPHCVVLRLELSEWLWKKSHREQPIVRLAMCERSSLGLPHTQNRMSGRPRVAEILLMRSPKTVFSIQYSVFSNCSATVTVSPSGPIKLFKGGTTAMSGVLARFPWLLPVFSIQ
jgi:hypothetical protein